MSRKGYTSLDGFSDFRQLASLSESITGSFSDVRSLVDAVPEWARNCGSLVSSIEYLSGVPNRQELLGGTASALAAQSELLRTAGGLEHTMGFYAEQALRRAGLADPLDKFSFSHLTQSLAAREVQETQKLIDSMTSAGYADDLVSSYASMSGLGSLVSQSAASYARDLASSSGSASGQSDHASRLLSESALSSSSLFAKQWTNSIQALSPHSLLDPVSRILEDIDFESFRSLVSAVSDRFATTSEDAAVAFSFDVLREIVDQSHLEDIAPAFVDAATAALKEAAQDDAVDEDSGLHLVTILCLLRIVVAILTVMFVHQALSRHRAEISRLSTAPASAPEKSTHIITYASVDGSKRDASPQQKNDNTTLVSVTTVKLRRGPHTTQSVVATIPPWQLLHRRKTKHNWSLVEYVDPQGEGSSTTGWVQTKYTSPLDEETERMILCKLMQNLQLDGGCDR